VKPRVAILVGLLAVGCDDLLPRIGFERMIDQPRGKSYAASNFFPDGKLMQAPPEGTIPTTPAPSIAAQAERDGVLVNAIPIAIDRALLIRGRDRFETFCATCHAIDGSGNSPIADNMELRKPPPLVIDPVRSYPVGRYYQAISAGYGLMPNYANELPVQDRWAVVAYVRALQRSRSSELAQLPEAVRKRAAEVLR
jgi:mono/diheme cytochrome c family protein